MANTRITQGVIKPNEDYDVRHIDATGIVTATSATITGNLSVGGVLTYEDVTNVDSVGIVTARTGVKVPTGEVTVGNNIQLGNAGVITATSFSGSGANLTGIDATALKDPAGNVKVQAQDSGAVHTGISTFDTIKVGSGVTIESNGQATFTGIVTFGSSSTTIDGDANTIKVGTALTLGHTQGLQFHTQNLHSDGFEINQINASGIITASEFRGSGANLSNLPAGLGTALSEDQSSPLNLFYYTNKTLAIDSTLTIDHPASAQAAYTQYGEIKVSDSADLIIAEGDDVIPDVLGLAEFGTIGGGNGAASAGRMRVNTITNFAANGAPTVSNGLIISGVTTTSEVFVGNNIKLDPISGIVTATSFVGDGSSLTGLAADKIFEGNTEVETIDTGSNGHIKFTTEGTVKARITTGGHVSIGHDGDVDTSNGNIGKKLGIRSTANNFIVGETTQTAAGYGLHIEGRQTGRSGGARITQISMRNDSSGNGEINFQTAQSGSDVTQRCTINAGGHFHPHLNATYDLGISGKAWRNLYVNDAHFSNEGHSNSVDGTWGSWTLQEGENDIFMINNRTGKKYAITMKEVE